jgi:hypothetical protein
MYAKVSRELFNAKSRHEKHNVIDNFFNKLKNKLPTKEQFIAKLDYRLYYSSKDTKNKKLVQYVLQRLEYEKQNFNIELHDVSIEHIYPEKIAEHWEAIEEKYIKNIGNLVLLDKSINSEIGNKNFNEKKSIILSKSTLITTKEVFENYTYWDKETIIERREQLIELLYKF